ncbi:MAG: cupin domain-containing protein [Candidatus Omnitrophica bacterium]|nr:cupin domain-containing protein [Candidatus Omnitrophota bacterium]
MNIEVRKPKEDELGKLAVRDWPIWEKEESRFDWFYDQKEICYFLEGEVEIELSTGEKIRIGKGDLAVFPQGLRCVWNVNKKVRKHYSFE